MRRRSSDTSFAPTPGYPSLPDARATLPPTSDSTSAAGAVSYAQGNGWAFAGPGFYVRDDDRRSATEWAEQLAALVRRPEGSPR